MFKKIVIIVALLAVTGVLVFGAVNRTLAKNGNEGTGTGLGGTRYGSDQSQTSVAQPGSEYLQGRGRGGNAQQGQGGAWNGEAGFGYQLPPASGELSAEESQALLYMREEEKLAHDVYATFYAQWGLPIFQNISQSEQTHTEAVKTLLDRYGLSDPASSEVGVFTNPDLQTLYNDLVAQGSQSLAEALKVGVEIEEIDIADLQARLAQTVNADIQQVFTNLLQASENHLRAFVSTLYTQTGETYQPQYLSADAYQAIITAGMGRGGNGNGVGNAQGGNGSRGGGQNGRP